MSWKKSIIKSCLPTTSKEWVNMFLMLPFSTYIATDIYVNFFHNKNLSDSFQKLASSFGNLFTDKTAYNALIIASILSILAIYLIVLIQANHKWTKTFLLTLIPIVLFVMLYIFMLLTSKKLGSLSLIFLLVSSSELSFIIQKYMVILFDKKASFENEDFIIHLIGVICYGYAIISLFK